jgi:hypothetical protein
MRGDTWGKRVYLTRTLHGVEREGMTGDTDWVM